MKGIFWNSRGLSDLAKSRYLDDTTKEQNLDFIALLETCKKDFSQLTLDKEFFMALDCTSWEVKWNFVGRKS
jgi:hypothetical protein